MKGKIIYILPFVLLVFLTRCANMVTPTGGPKDIQPPKVTEAKPENHHTQFDGKKIEITFDEFVTLDNASQNMLFSPPLNTKPDIKLSNKTVVIKFKEELRPNTTYTINFGNAVKDLHEGNVFKDYIYSFATGDVLDTLTMAGKVVNADNKKPAENLLVTLYVAGSDSLYDFPTQRVPDFIAKTDKEGNFKLEGLPDTTFLVFALEDMNANLYYDMPNEKVAFLDTLVQAPCDNINLYAFTEADTTQMLLEKKLIDEGVFRFVFRRPADSVIFETPNVSLDSLPLVKVWSQTHDTLWWYFNPKEIDTLRVNIIYDTIINERSLINLKYKEQSNRRNNKPKRIAISYNLKNSLLLPGEDLVFRFSEPLAEIRFHDTSSLQANDVILYNQLAFEPNDPYGMSYRLATVLEDSASYTLNVVDSVFYGISGHTNDVISLRFKRAKETDLGNIQLQVIPPEGTPLVVQLLSDKGMVLDSRAVDSAQLVQFKQLMPNKYKLQAIIDGDGDGRWSTGNYHRRFLPETVVEYKDILEVKAGWDIELEEPWDLKK